MSKILLIDYENIQGIDLSQLKGKDFKVRIFAGNSQNKIPIELVASAQLLGSQVEWVRIEGNGPNALDFHIAYYLGGHASKDARDEYFILSKDRGFDPLIRHMGKENIRCRRITSMAELLSAKRSKNADGDYQKVLSNLKKIAKDKRPRNREKLRQHIRSVMGKTSTEDRLNGIIAQLISSKAIMDMDGKLSYRI
jgi:hypothetical protein